MHVSVGDRDNEGVYVTVYEFKPGDFGGIEKMSQRAAVVVSSSSSTSSSSVSPESSESDTYEVERIMDHRVDPHGRRRFLLKWKGYSHDDDTWEKEENLNCPDLINEYMRSVKRQKDTMIAKGRMIEPPDKILKAFRDTDEKLKYQVRYKDGHTEKLASSDLFKLNPPLMISFLEKAAGFVEDAHIEGYLDYQFDD